MTQAYQTYQQLVERVEAFGQAILQRYPSHMTCQSGCDGCCYQHFTIFPVEAEHLTQAVAALSPQARRRLRHDLTSPQPMLQMAGEPEPCVLLEEGRCRLYHGRPLICRMQGYPLFSQLIDRDDGGQRDCCPLNFTDMALRDIETPFVFNLDLVNQTLASINHLFVQDQPQADHRISLRQAVLQALDQLAESDVGEDAEPV